MGNEIKPNFKYVFLGHFVIGMTYGLLLSLVPAWFGSMVNWPYEEFYFSRLSGVLMLANSVGSILAFRETEWDKVDIYVKQMIVWFFLGLMVNIYALVAITQVFMMWITALVTLGLLGVFVWMYMKHK